MDEENPQSNVLYSRAVGLVAGGVKSRGVADVHGYIVNASADSQMKHSIASFILNAVAISSTFMVDFVVSPSIPILKLTGP